MSKAADNSAVLRASTWSPPLTGNLQSTQSLLLGTQLGSVLFLSRVDCVPTSASLLPLIHPVPAPYDLMWVPLHTTVPWLHPSLPEPTLLPLCCLALPPPPGRLLGFRFGSLALLPQACSRSGRSGVGEVRPGLGGRGVGRAHFWCVWGGWRAGGPGTGR